MKNKSDNYLAEKAKNGCSESLTELINRHSNLFYNVCYKFAKRNDCLDYKDMVEDAPYIIHKSVCTFKNNKGTKFSTWLGYMSRFYCLDLIKEKKPLIAATNEDLDLFNLIKNKFYTDRNERFGEYVDDILSQAKDKRIIDIFNMRFEDSKKTSWKIIAKKMNLSVTHCINLFEKGRKLLYTKIKSENLFDKI